jgi:hypothetical protein
MRLEKTNKLLERDLNSLPNFLTGFAAGISRKVWVMYLASDSMDSKFQGFTRKSFRIEPETHYHAYFFDPRTGQDIELGTVQPDAEGWWKIPAKPSREDWVLVLETSK